MARTKTRAEQIMEKLFSTIEGISTGAGYLTTPRHFSRRWRMVDQFEQNQYPAVVLVLDREVIRHETNRQAQGEVHVSAWCYVRVEEHATTSANQDLQRLLGDVKQALQSVQTVGADENGEDLAFAVEVVEVETDGGFFEPYGYAAVRARVDYEHPLSAP